MFKKILRVLFKIPATPVITIFLIFAILMVYAAMFFEWLYDAEPSDKRITRGMKQDAFGALKKWYTTV